MARLVGPEEHETLSQHAPGKPDGLERKSKGGEGRRRTTHTAT